MSEKILFNCNYITSHKRNTQVLLTPACTNSGDAQYSDNQESTGVNGSEEIQELIRTGISHISQEQLQQQSPGVWPHYSLACSPTLHVLTPFFCYFPLLQPLQNLHLYKMCIVICLSPCRNSL